MAIRTWFPAAFCACVILAWLPAAPVAAQDVMQPQVDNSPYHYLGQINANSVYVRSGPGENYYATAKLDRGTQVTVVGHKFEWLKIVPPPGSFSVVAKAFVQRQGDSGVGKVVADTLNVRAGSSLSPMKVTVQCKLKKGDEVTILGEQDEYYQIKPPPDAYLYVHQRYVDPVKQIAGPRMIASAGPATRPAGTEEAAVESLAQNQQPRQDERKNETEAGSSGQTIAAATTRPSDEQQRAEAEAEFDRLEAQMRKLPGMPLDQQPVEQLLAAYEKLLAGEHLPVSMRRTAEVRAATLRVKNAAKQELVQTLREREAEQARLAALAAEREALENRLAASRIFTAVGVLQASTLQVGSQTLYRLTDPASGRTLCYVRSNEPQYVKFIGQFVGIKGDMGEDPQLTLRVISATGIMPVDPATVGKGVTAQVVPPSLLSNPPAEQATISGN